MGKRLEPGADLEPARIDFPDDETMRISHEAIYQACSSKDEERSNGKWWFITTIEFRPSIQRQGDDAANKGQIGRQKIFDGLLTRLDDQAS